jgi:precorrin-3B methylase
LTHQAIAAKSILALYNWWKVERPARVDPWIELIEKYPQHQFGMKMSEEYKKALEFSRVTEDNWYKEDTEKLVELISMRESLWT